MDSKWKNSDIERWPKDMQEASKRDGRTLCEIDYILIGIIVAQVAFFVYTMTSEK